MDFEEPQIIGSSDSIRKVREVIARVADVDLNVLIIGESGVGKELVARAIHYYSSRRNKPFVKVNCAALPSELIESELFGYEKGAFTGADRIKKGKFEIAEDGSIFLDEIGEIPLSMQAKLLQVLQDQRYPRIGGNEDITTQARVIAATNRNLEADIMTGTFREDLYFRISTIRIHVTPLRERKNDIPPLIDYFLKRNQEKHGLRPVPISSSLLEVFMAYHWPGNIRELENYLKRVAVMGNGEEIERELRRILRIKRAHQDPRNPQFGQDIISETTEAVLENENVLDDSFPSLKEIRDRAVNRIERNVIEFVLEETNWNRREAAKILKISYRTLLYKIKQLDIRKYD